MNRRHRSGRWRCRPGGRCRSSAASNSIRFPCRIHRGRCIRRGLRGHFTYLSVYLLCSWPWYLFAAGAESGGGGFEGGGEVEIGRTVRIIEEHPRMPAATLGDGLGNGGNNDTGDMGYDTAHSIAERQVKCPRNPYNPYLSVYLSRSWGYSDSAGLHP